MIRLACETLKGAAAQSLLFPTNDSRRNAPLPMTIHYILIDFENVQPSAAELGLIRGPDCHVRLFLGPHQTKLDVDLVKALQPLGAQVEYVQCDRKGKNALDFRIAFVLGRIVQEREVAASPTRREVRFIVVSNDAGFDELLDHLRTMGYDAARSANIESSITGAAKPTANDDLAKAIANLREHPRNRPKTAAGLLRHLKTLLGKDATDARVQSLRDRLCRLGLARVVDGKVEYSPPEDPGKAAA
jgi:hypothetical protein